MTERSPIVNISGTLSELPAGDVLKTSLAATTQVLGFTPTSILEIEANTRAARVTVRPQDNGQAQELAFAIGHHKMGIIGGFQATTSWTVFSEMVCAQYQAGGCAVLQKVECSICTSAVSGTRAGTARLMLMECNPMIDLGIINTYMLPPIGSSPGLTGSAYSSLRGRQPLPLLNVEFGGLLTVPNGPGAFTGSVNSGKTLGELGFGVRSAIGTDLKPTMLFDGSAAGSYVMAQQQGFFISLNYPVAVTSQTVQYAVNLTWDEWVPIPLSAF